jgi:23S rRNA (uracil1939-C5)-methyltransferase
VGFFGRGSHELVEVRRCLVVVPELDAALSALSDLPVAARAVLARFAGAELRAAPDGQIDLELVAREGVTTNEAELAELRGLLEPFRVRRAGGSPGALRRYPLPGGAFLSVPDGAFTQVNWDVNAELVGRVVAGARTQGAASFLDLYAGVGNFSVPLAHTGLRGVAVEQHRGAVSGLRAALAEQKLDCEVVLGDVEGSLERLRRAKRRFDLVILDPPRAGAKEVVPKLLALAPQRIAYVACDPVTLARDARALLAGGYTLAELVCFDMFPQTHHVETLAWFARPIAPALVT